MNGQRQQLTLRANDQPQDAAAFGNLVVAGRPNSPVRLNEIASVADGVANERIAAWRNDDRALVLAVLRQPDANTVDVVDGVKASLPALEAALPPGAKINVMLDRSRSIRAAVHDVQESLAIAIGLVVLVCFIFLRRISATLIPTIAVPISLCVAFGLMYVLGYGIDNVTLLGLTIAVGLVVDDAIVVLEAIMRHMEEGMAPIPAAIKGSREIGFTVLSITISLVAVFLPILLMGGVVGRVFNAFAATVCLSVIASCIVSLTLTPLMASRLPAHAKPGLVERVLERFLSAIERGYAAMLDFALKFRFLVWIAFFASLGAAGYMAVVIPKGFFPIEDTGLLTINTEGPRGASYRRHGRDAGPALRQAAGIAGGRQRGLQHRRDRRQHLDQPGPHVRRAEAGRGTAGDHRGDPAAAAGRQPDRRAAGLHPADPEPELRLPPDPDALSLFAAGPAAGRAL